MFYYQYGSKLKFVTLTCKPKIRHRRPACPPTAAVGQVPPLSNDCAGGIGGQRRTAKVVAVEVVYRSPLTHGNAGAAVMIILRHPGDRHRPGCHPRANVAHVVRGADAEGDTLVLGGNESGFGLGGG